MNPMTNMKNVKKLSEQDLKSGWNSATSWHNQYKHSAWVFVGGLPYDLTEGDVITIFSQYGEVVNLNLVRDKKTGKQKGFCFICYEDQRSTVLAVDNFNGIKLLGRTLRVDHCDNYKPPEDKEDDAAVTLQLKERGCAPDVHLNDDHELPDEDELLPLDPKDSLKSHKKKKKVKKGKKKKRYDSSEEDVERPLKEEHRASFEHREKSKSRSLEVYKERGRQWGHDKKEYKKDKDDRSGTNIKNVSEYQRQRPRSSDHDSDFIEKKTEPDSRQRDRDRRKLSRLRSRSRERDHYQKNARREHSSHSGIPRRQHRHDSDSD